MNLGIFDPVRNRWVKATPEELVRQKIIQKMIGELGYPKGLIAVEKELVPENFCGRVLSTGRRFDLVCYAKSGEGVRPLLLIECKAHTIDEAAARQAWGYNASIGAPFLSLVSGNAIRTLWQAKGKIESVSFLPPFADLMSKVCF